MIAHVVLYTPRADLSPSERERFEAALIRALESIPSVRRYRVGRRLRLGTAYDATSAAYRFVGILEFDDRQGLESYLRHPSHAELGRCFHEMSAEAIACDFEVVDSDLATALATWAAGH